MPAQKTVLLESEVLELAMRLGKYQTYYRRLDTAFVHAADFEQALSIFCNLH